MAPGWMTSRTIYNTIVRPKWLDEQGEYAYKSNMTMLYKLCIAAHANIHIAGLFLVFFVLSRSITFT
jgi:hypothetical protein